MKRIHSFWLIVMLANLSCEDLNVNKSEASHQEKTKFECKITSTNITDINRSLGYDKLDTPEITLHEYIDTVYCFTPIKFIIYPTDFYRGSMAYSIFAFDNSKLKTYDASLSFFDLLEFNQHVSENGQAFYSIKYKYYAQDSFWLILEVFSLDGNKRNVVFKDDIYAIYYEGQENENELYNSYDIRTTRDSIKISKLNNQKRDYLEIESRLDD